MRAALKKYLDAYGTPAAMEDGPKVLKMLHTAMQITEPLNNIQFIQKWKRLKK